jgi:hypothetical protein
MHKRTHLIILHNDTKLLRNEKIISRTRTLNTEGGSSSKSAWEVTDELDFIFVRCTESNALISCILTVAFPAVKN